MKTDSHRIKFRHIFKVFSEIAKRFSNKTAIILTKRGYGCISNLSYATLYNNSLKIASFLKHKGINPQDKIAIILEDQLEYAEVFFSVMAVDGVAVAFDVQLPSSQLGELLHHAEIRYVITTKNLKNRIINVIDTKKLIVLDDEHTRDEIAESIPLSENEYGQNTGDEAVIFYTSGSTDTPKAVVLTHTNLLANFNSILQLNLVGKDDVVLSILPLHHAFAFTTTFLSPLMIGATVAYPNSIASADLLYCMQTAHITVFVGVPQIFSIIHKFISRKFDTLSIITRGMLSLLSSIFFKIRIYTGFNLNKLLFKRIHVSFGSRLRFMVSGGARLDTDMAYDFMKWGFTILEGYGLTETSPVVTFNPISKPKIGSVGKPLPNVQVKIVEKDNDGIGEIIVKGDNVMKGYYKLPEATSEVIKKGWFFTGDLGYLDEDNYLYITGRKNDMIVLSSGKNINPEEIETYYEKNPFIKEICILSFTSSRLKGVDSLSAIIVIDEEEFKRNNETRIQEKIKWELDTMAAGLPSYKRIKRFVISKTPLPRTRLGKIMRYKAKELFEQLSNLSVSDKSQEGQCEKIDIYYEDVYNIGVSFIENTLKRKVSASDHLELDLGLDSLERIELLLNLQERLNLKLSDESAMDFFMCNTIGELTEQLKRHVDAIKEKNTKVSSIQWSDVLNEDLQPETSKKICLSPSLYDKIINIPFILLFKLFFRIFYLLRTEGRESLKNISACIITPNHTSYLDGLFILSALPIKVIFNTYFVGFANILESPILKPFVRTARLIPINANFNPTEALKACAYLLRHSKIICYFPEGHRSIDGRVNEFKKGIGILIKELNASALPVYIEGAFGTWSRGQKFPRLKPVKVKFGKPISATHLYSHHDKFDGDVYEVIAENLRQKLIEISNK